MTDETRVLFNGDCPICSREIAHYAAYAQDHDLPVRFDDLTNETLRRDWGIDPEVAAKRIHVLKDGQVHVGVDGFAVLWAEMPRFAWLARVVRAPIVRPVARAVYDWVLAPALYALHRRRKRIEARG